MATIDTTIYQLRIFHVNILGISDTCYCLTHYIARGNTSIHHINLMQMKKEYGSSLYFSS